MSRKLPTFSPGRRPGQAPRDRQEPGPPRASAAPLEQPGRRATPRRGVSRDDHHPDPSSQEAATAPSGSRARPVGRRQPPPPMTLHLEVKDQLAPSEAPEALLPLVVSLYQSILTDWPYLDRFFAEQLREHQLSDGAKGFVVSTLQQLVRQHGRLSGTLGRLIDPETASLEPASRLDSVRPESRARLLVAAWMLTGGGLEASQAASLAGVREPAQLQALSRLTAALEATDELLQPMTTGKAPLDIARMAEGLSLPLWLTSLWVKERSPSVAFALGKALLKPAPMTLRVAPHRLEQDEARRQLKHVLGRKPERTRISPYGFTLAERIPIERMVLYRAGAVEVQDEASQIAAMAVQPQPGQRVLDLCAGAGGKLLLVASLQLLAGRPGETYACDPHRGRLQELRRRLARGGIGHVQVREADALDPHALVDLRGRLDWVLVDAPCSGLGALRRNPEARWRLQPQDVARFPAQQLALLEKAATLLKRHGRLVYVTCTLNRAENQEVVRAAQAFGLHPVALWPSDHPLALSLQLTPDQHEIELLPHRHQTDGFYIAALEKR